jgi:serine/threonine protein kinase
MASLIGKEIRNYRITERIGIGGMAEVYLGKHILLDRLVAIKVMHGFLSEHEHVKERFKREAKAVAHLRHPNIVQVYDFDIQDDLIFMVMEYIEGTNLQKELVRLGEEGKRFPIKQIGSIINDIASALDYAHSRGMLHRDIKPSNILIDKEGKAYLTDFGIAKIFSDQKITATGTLMGTPAYMSPEQAKGDELTEESDIYSLGIVAFEMLTGQVPYDAKTPIAIVFKQINDPVPEISRLVEDVPTSAQDVIDRALAKSPEVRYSSAEELVRALRIALEALESTETIPVIPIESEADEKMLYDTQVMSAEEMASIEHDKVIASSKDESTSKVIDQPASLMKEEPISRDLDQPTMVMEDEIESREIDKSTVVMQDESEVNQFDRPTALMADEEILEYKGFIDQEGTPEEYEDHGGKEGSRLSGITPIEDKTVAHVHKQKIPLWVVTIAAAIALIAIVILALTQVIDLRKPLVELVFDANNTESGLSLVMGGYKDVEIVIEGGKPAWRSGNGRILSSSDENLEADNNLYFNIDDNQIYQVPLGTEIHIEVWYWDLGYDCFNIEYDANTGNRYMPYLATNSVCKTNSSETKTAKFILNDAYLANRLGNSDFIITDNNDGAETIYKVKVTMYAPLGGNE